MDMQGLSDLGATSRSRGQRVNTGIERMEIPNMGKRNKAEPVTWELMKKQHITDQRINGGGSMCLLA
jgi:hypothetical protein